MSASAVGPMGYAKMNTASFVSIHALAGSTESHPSGEMFRRDTQDIRQNDKN